MEHKYPYKYHHKELKDHVYGDEIPIKILVAELIKGNLKTVMK